MLSKIVLVVVFFLLVLGQHVETKQNSATNIRSNGSVNQNVTITVKTETL